MTYLPKIYGNVKCKSRGQFVLLVFFCSSVLYIYFCCSCCFFVVIGSGKKHGSCEGFISGYEVLETESAEDLAGLKGMEGSPGGVLEYSCYCPNMTSLSLVKIYTIN